jgi:hypothetical protein
MRKGLSQNGCARLFVKPEIEAKMNGAEKRTKANEMNRFGRNCQREDWLRQAVARVIRQAVTQAGSF